MNSKLSSTFICCCLLLLITFHRASSAEIDQTRNSLAQTADLFSQIIEKAKPAVVYIQVKKKPEKNSRASQESLYQDPVLKNFFGDKLMQHQATPFNADESHHAFGSGFIFNSEGYILTNSHVIRDAVEITATLADRTEHKAYIIGEDRKTDIGLLKISGSDFPSIPLGNSDREKTGAWVLAIGSPYKFIQTVTAGIISATGRNGIGISDYENFIQTDAAINPGNSGGPLINIHGQAIGVNTAFLTQTGGYMGIGFAVPINMARLVAEQLLKDGKVTRASLGVSLQDASLDQLIEQGVPVGRHAAVILKVTKHSAAERAGLQNGDLITAINDTAIMGAADVRNRISLTAPNSLVSLEIYRDTSMKLVSVTLGEL
jgi:serine protease Do